MFVLAATFDQEWEPEETYSQQEMKSVVLLAIEPMQDRMFLVRSRI